VPASLLLLLKGPMQSWGDSSRYRSRSTSEIPTKSGVVGLLAAAEGRRRTDPVEDLAALTFAVRVDQPGTLLRDYQTAQQWQTGGKTNLVTRHYLSDAAFVAAVQAPERGVLEGLEAALRSPRFPLYLGRRSCPAPPKLVLGIRDTDAVDALRSERTWYATSAHQKERSRTVELPIYRDAAPGEPGAIRRRDVPVSFSQEHREYGWRDVVRDEPLVLENENGTSTDPFFEAVLNS
jgi:CRISPR system Cascade subunit CasD